MSDLNLSYGFGPESSAPRNRTLLLILRKGDLHKERHTTTKQVGVQRPRDYRQCAVFATGILFIFRLRKLEHRFNFHHLDPDVRNAWWDIPLTETMTYDEESSESTT
jgi:hypothetical protein